MLQRIKGLGASEGIAIAKALLLQPPKLDIKKTTTNDVAGEIAKMGKAIAVAIEQIDRIAEKAKGKLKAEDLEIFVAHKQIANDPFLSEQIKEFIHNNHFNAGYAINQIFSDQEKAFLAMDNQYMRERAVDIRDVNQRILNNYYGVKNVDLASIDEEVIIVGYDLTPSETGQLDKKFTKGFVTDIGGRTSHSVIMARSLQIPAVVGTKSASKEVHNNDLLIIDGFTGDVLINPSKATIEEYRQKMHQQEQEAKDLHRLVGKPTISQDGVVVKLAANIGTPIDLEGALQNDAEEIGLFRSEFLYMDESDWPSEHSQFNAYKEVLQGMRGKRVIVRTLDIGGDKKLKYFKFPEEGNPFLGYRAIRFCLDNKPIFKTQLRALLRASAFGRLAIMFPMIAVVDEFLAAKKFLEEVQAELLVEGHKIGKYEVGMMVEIPAAVINIETFAKHADFFSIGTNDLIQYSMAADRMSEQVSYLYQPLAPAILNLIHMTIKGAHKFKKPVGMCGELAGNANVIPLLLAMGLDEFSMSASSILKARKQIGQLSKKVLAAKLEEILQLESQAAVQEYLAKHFNLKYS